MDLQVHKLQNIFVRSSKGPEEGESGVQEIIGLAIHDDNVSVSNAIIEDCFYGCRVSKSGDVSPCNVNVSGLIVRGNSGKRLSTAVYNTLTQAEKDAFDYVDYAVSTTTDTKNVSISGIVVDCLQGISIGGSHHNINLIIQDTDYPIQSVSNTCNYDLDVCKQSTASWIDQVPTNPTIAQITEGANLIRAGEGSVSFDLRSTRVSNSWATDTPIGALNIYSNDGSGVKAGLRGQLGLYPTGGTNSSNVWKFNVNKEADSKFFIAGDKAGSSVPFSVPLYDVDELPSPSDLLKATLAFVNNDKGGFVLAFCDGTNWRRSTDRAIVSV